MTQSDLILAVYLLFYSVSNDEPGMLPILGDIPSDLSADDVLSDIAMPLINSANAGVGGALGLGVGTVIGAVTGVAVGAGVGVGVGGNGALNEAPPLGSTALVVEVLKELDKDYMALRSRLVNLLEQQAHSPSLPLSIPQSPSVASSESESQTLLLESSGSLRENHSGDISDGSDGGVGALDVDRKPSGGSLSIGDYTDTDTNTGTDAISHPHPIINDEVTSTAHGTASSSSSSSSGSAVNHLDRLDKPRTVYWPSRQLVRT